MLRFLRRVFVILVLLFVAFVIFRIVNPTWAANFVAKVKTIPQTISWWFHRKADDAKNVVIDWIDTVLTWDILQPKESETDIKNDDLSNSHVSVTSDKKASRKDNKKDKKKDDDSNLWWDSINDFVWLEKLNKETEDMLWIKTGKDTSINSGTVIIVNSGCDNEVCKKIEQDLKNLEEEIEKMKLDIAANSWQRDTTTWVTIVEIPTPVETGNQLTWNTDIEVNNQTTVQPIPVKTTTKKRTNCCDANCVLSQSECAEANMIWNLFK